MKNITNIFKYGKVISVDDDLDGDRIRVHVKGVDSTNFRVEDIPYAFPLLPKTLYTKPKVGETVFCFSQDGSFNDDRFWIGPIISQPHKIGADLISGQSFLKSGIIKPDIAPSTDPDNVGVQLENDDIGLQGRGSTDIILKPDEVRIRAGKTLDSIKLNKENPSYAQIKYDKVDGESSVNIVSDYINLLSHKSVDRFDLTDANNMITRDEFQKIKDKAHQLPFGDVLIEFMDLFMKAFLTHVHAYHGLAPDSEQIEIKNLLAYDLDKILSKNIRIN